MLIESLFEEYIFINRTVVSDGEGGFKPTYVDGAEFLATVTRDNSVVGAIKNIGNKDVTSTRYSVASPVNAKLSFGDTFKSKKTGQAYIVVDKGREAPKIASYQYNLTIAEEWEVPND